VVFRAKDLIVYIIFLLRSFLHHLQPSKNCEQMIIKIMMSIQNRRFICKILMNLQKILSRKWRKQ